MKGIGMKRFTGYSAAMAVIAAGMLAGCPAPTEYHTQVLTSPNTIDGKQIYFIPEQADSKRAGDTNYSRLVSETDLQTLPNTTAGTAVTFPAEGPAEIALSEGVFYFGELYDTLFVSSDGSIGLGQAGGGNATLAAHFSSQQISLLPVDATISGTVTVAETADFVVVTYSGMTIDGTTDNAFQVEFFKTRGIDGDVVLSYPQVIATADGLIGLSNGELAGATQAEIDAFVAAFVSSNFAVAVQTSAVQAAS